MAAEIAVASIGGALVACASSADERWLDRHFLPGFFVSRHLYVLVASFVRVLTAALGASLALVARRRIGRFIAHTPARALHLAVAVVLAFGASELILRQLPRR